MYSKESLCLTGQDKQKEFWMLDDTHFPRPLTPLFASLMLPAVTIGSKRAFENMKMPISQFIAKLKDGYYYQANPLHSEPFEERILKHHKKMEELYPGIQSYLEKRVNEFYMPFYQQLYKWSSSALSLTEAFEYLWELKQFYEKAWEYHFEVTMPRTSLAISLEEAYGKVTGEQDTKKVYDLLQGVMNMSLETDRGLWLLANQVKATPLLGDALSKENPLARLKETEEGREFIKDLQDFLSIYGHRKAITHEFTEETWFENPDIALSIIQTYIARDFDFDAEFNQVVLERELKVKKLVEAMPAGEERERFITLYTWALNCWGADEDHHFYIDAMISANSRYFLKNVGRTLVEHQVLEHEEDIFFLYLDDLLEALQNPRSFYEVVERNKASYTAYLHKKPASFYGKPPSSQQDLIVERIFGVPKERKQQDKSFKGNGASAGTYSGEVKVLHGQGDFSKLTKGDILVCKTTAPSWTVLFPIAGALITDAGGILSHASIIAREYKLPAVVGTKVATSMLQDGDVVTVDGTNGIVYLED